MDVLGLFYDEFMHANGALIAAEVLLFFPIVALAFAGEWFRRGVKRLPEAARLGAPAAGGLVYWLAAHGSGPFRWAFVGVYGALPVALVLLLWDAGRRDTEQRGGWRDYLVLLVLGVVVEFRFFEPVWPAAMRSLNRLILLDTALYGFLAIRQLSGVGFDFVPRPRDLKNGLRELAFYAPIALPLGLALHFLHPNNTHPSVARAVLTWLSIWAFVAVLEEAYFRGLIQNLAERRIGRRAALLLTAVLFGLSHFNKGATSFNWRYVILATLAGIFYGRAWRSERRLMASTITHASVDTIWALWLQ